MEKISKEEVRENMKRMKNGKAVGPDDIPVEVWKCLGEIALEFLTKLFNRTMESERMPEEYMCVNERQVKGTVKMQGEEVEKVEDFKYLGSTVQSNGECGREVKKRVQAG